MNVYSKFTFEIRMALCSLPVTDYSLCPIAELFTEKLEVLC